MTAAASVALAPRATSATFQGTRDEALEVLTVVALRLLQAPAPHRLRYGLPQDSEVELVTPDGVRCWLSVSPSLALPSARGAICVGSYELTLALTGGTPVGPERATEILRAAHDIALTRSEMRQLRRQMPLTVGFPDMVADKPLRDLAGVFTIHHMTDFLMMIESALQLGLAPESTTVIDKEYAYSMSARVDAHLRHELGLAVYRYSQLDAALDAHWRRAEHHGHQTIVLDDGGYVLPRLIEQRVPAAVIRRHVVGVVEQTMSGIWRLDRVCDRPPVPVFSVAESSLKATVESYGVADAAVRNTVRLLENEKFEGRCAAVLGFGRIGQEVAEILRTRRMRVAVYDHDVLRLLTARERGFHTFRTVEELFGEHRPMIVFGAAGRGSISGEVWQHIRHDCYLVSTTSRDFEFDLPGLRARSHQIDPVPGVGTRYRFGSGVSVLVLADGYPINFFHAESMPNRYSDIVLASMLAGACALVDPTSGLVPGHNRDISDRLLRKSPIVDEYYTQYAT